MFLYMHLVFFTEDAGQQQISIHVQNQEGDEGNTEPEIWHIL